MLETTLSNDGLEAFARRQRPDLTLDQLTDAFQTEVNALRAKKGKKPIDSAQPTLAEAFEGRGMINLNRQALANVLRCRFEIVKEFTPRRSQIRAIGANDSLHETVIVGTGRLRSYKSWHDPAISKLISAAHDKVIFVDSWFDEGFYFRERIHARKKYLPNRKLNVQLYLLADTVAGGRRIGEIKDQTPQQRAALAPAREREYESNFNSGTNEAYSYFHDDSVELTLYGYDLMPGLRLMIIDDTNFIFSWFPVEGYSAKNVCFGVSVESSYEADQLTIECLRRQMAAIERNSSLLNVIGAEIVVDRNQ